MAYQQVSNYYSEAEVRRPRVPSGNLPLHLLTSPLTPQPQSFMAAVLPPQAPVPALAPHPPRYPFRFKIMSYKEEKFTLGPVFISSFVRSRVCSLGVDSDNKVGKAPDLTTTSYRDR